MSNSELFTKENMVMGGLISAMAWGAFSIMGMRAQNAVDEEINGMVRQSIPEINKNMASIQVDMEGVKHDIVNIVNTQQILKRDLDELEDQIRTSMPR